MRSNPFGTKGALIHPCGRVRSAEGLSPHRKLSPRSDMAALPQQGTLHFPCDSLRCLPFCVLAESEHLATQAIHFQQVLISYPGGDTHSNLPLQH